MSCDGVGVITVLSFFYFRSLSFREAKQAGASGVRLLRRTETFAEAQRGKLILFCDSSSARVDFHFKLQSLGIYT